MPTRKLAGPAIKALTERKDDLGSWEAVATEIIAWWRSTGDKASTVDRVLLGRAAKSEAILATKAAALERWAATNPAKNSSNRPRWESPKDCDPPFEPSLTGNSVEAYWWMRAVTLRAKPAFKSAILVHYSGQWASSLIAALLHRCCDVSLYLCDPYKAISTRQLIRIQDTFLNVESEFSLYDADVNSRLRIYRYDGSKSGPRYALLDADLVCRGFYDERPGTEFDGRSSRPLHGHDLGCKIKFACDGYDIGAQRAEIMEYLKERNADPEDKPFYEAKGKKPVNWPKPTQLRLHEAIDPSVE